MRMRIQVNLDGCGIQKKEIEQYRALAEQKLDELWSGNIEYTGWVRRPLTVIESEISLIEQTAEQIRRQSDCLLVLGVGGSYIGAKALIDLLGEEPSGTEVLFVGYHFSARSLRELFQKIEKKDVSLCVISKSGSTAETMAAYGIFREFLISRYGKKEAVQRTFFITENRSNIISTLAAEEGTAFFPLAEDIGGRYSVLTSVGLLPAAVVGINIRLLLKGAADIASPDYFHGQGLDYAIARQLFYQAGKKLEVFEFFDPYASYLGEWIKQLFGESEGKDKRAFPGFVASQQRSALDGAVFATGDGVLFRNDDLREKRKRTGCTDS